MSIILCGFRRCGKTVYGKKLAQELGWEFIDTDLLINPNYREVYREVGERAFRILEREAICRLVVEKPAVIATGAGSVLDPQVVAHLKKLGKIVYLKVDKEELRRRNLADPHAGELTQRRKGAKGEEFDFERAHAERIAVYEQIADEVIVS